MNFFEFPTEVRFGSEFQFRRRGFARVTLRDKLLRQAALQIPNPSTRRALKVLLKNSLELTF